MPVIYYDHICSRLKILNVTGVNQQIIPESLTSKAWFDDKCEKSFLLDHMKLIVLESSIQSQSVSCCSFALIFHSTVYYSCK